MQCSHAEAVCSEILENKRQPHTRSYLKIKHTMYLVLCAEHIVHHEEMNMPCYAVRAYRHAMQAEDAVDVRMGECLHVLQDTSITKSPCNIRRCYRNKVQLKRCLHARYR